MIHPSDLLRSDSRSKQFTAPLNLQGQSDNDWGIYIFPCLAKLFNWKTFARPWLFTTILSLIGFVQGFLLFYFRNTSEIWSRQYGISKGTTEWIIYVNEFFVGLVALPISYWASITHKIKWISLITFCHGIFSIFMFIPERIFAKAMIIPNSSVLLCGGEYQRTHEDTNLAALTYIIIYQLIGATASVAFYSLGLVYMNENIIRNKPTILAIALASKLSGQQFGVYAAWLPNWFNNFHIFKSFVWQSCCFFYLLLTIGISMFPKVLPSLLIKKLAASLLEVASGISTSEGVKPQEDGFFSTMRRIVSNGIILLSMVSAVAMESALINFDIFENYFKQSRYLISDNFDNFGFTSPFSMNLVANVMEKPLTISCLIIAGLVISRKRAEVKYLILWNIAIYSVVSILFVGNLFSKCEYEDIAQLVPSCSVDCNCTLDETFNPVCLKGRTYYSPCHAGCRTLERIEEYQIYKNCTCASFEGTATEGSCHLYSCGLHYEMWQMNNIVIRGLLATTVVTNIVIVLSIVRVTDQSVTLGLEMSLLSLVPFLPVRWVYQIVAEKLCRHWYLGKCRIYSPQLSSFIFNATILLMLIGTVTQMILLATKMSGPEQPSRIRKNRKNSDISSKRAASVNLDTDASEDSDYFDGDHGSHQDLDLTEKTRGTENSIIMCNPKAIETHL